MKKAISGLVLTIIAILLVACGSSDAEGDNAGSNDGDKTIRAGIGLNENHPQYKGLERFKEIVEEKTDGAIQVKLYPSEQLGSDREMIQAVQNGNQEVTIPSTATVANFVPEFNVLNFPFLFPDKETADAVLDGETGEKLLKMLEAKGMVGLGFWEEGFYNVTNNVRPIETVEDFEGIKLRTMENELLLDVYSELGTNPTPMAFGEVYTALQQGTVDGQTNPLSQAYTSKFYEVQEYLSATHEYYGVWPFIINKDFFDSLTNEQQNIIREAEKEARKHQRELNRTQNEDFLKNLKEEGIKYNEVTPEAREEMRKKIQPLLDDAAKDIPGDIAEEFFDSVEKAKQN
ncbi:TRAP transporter substrate-binding protein [Virgibacillus doumboii]|uniref:TRAP transporter substrate-binding protein n=1 Tax=Virgibacillus doumboii TaxID=2697503 RepID=UPI0013DF890B|nr:TRAP transporter substrate-binding protein [Virgibacillus doumboii]